MRFLKLEKPNCNTFFRLVLVSRGFPHRNVFHREICIPFAQLFNITIVIFFYNFFFFLYIDQKPISKVRIFFDFSKLIISHSAILTFVRRRLKRFLFPPHPLFVSKRYFSSFFRDWSSVEISQQQYWEMNYWMFSEQASPAARWIVLILNRREWASVRFSGSDKRIRIITARKRFSLPPSPPWL